MDEPFELPVTYKGEELLFPAQLLRMGYTHKFQVEVYGTGVYFERDDAMEYRALVDPEVLGSNKQLDVQLLQAIAETIKDVTT